MLTGATSGSLATFFLGMLGDKYETDKFPERFGYILAGAVLTSYIGCIPFFLLNAKYYAQNILYQRFITNYVARKQKEQIL
jgi:hypothetical protein